MKIRKIKRFLWRVFLLFFFWLIIKSFFDIKIALKNEKEQVDLKKIGVSLKDKVYSEATVHNPKGDFLPDWVDDVLKGKIKDEWKIWQKSSKKEGS